MAYNFGQELSNRIHLPTDCDLDGLPLHAARNRYGHLYSLSDRALGHNAWFRAICRGNGKPVPSCSAVLDGCAHHNCDGAFGRHSGTRAGCGGAAGKRSEHEPRGQRGDPRFWFWKIPGGEERWVTKKWKQLFGFADSEPVTFDRFLEVVPPGDSERVKQVVQHMLEHGGEYEIEYRITRDGSIRWIATHGRVELDERGKPVLARGVSRDITERKIAEEELRESEARFRTVANAAPVMIWMSGPDKLCTFFNKGWLDFTGRTLEQELGNGWAEGVHREDLDRCLDVYQNSFKARESFSMEYRLRRSDGEYRWVLDSGTPRFASDGAFIGYIGSCIDLTERKTAEEEASRRREQVELLGRVSLLGEMTASLAHELNQPLTAIVNNATAAMQYLEQ